MKKLTCRDLGGACDEEITGNSFEEMGNNCKAHVMEKSKIACPNQVYCHL